MRLARHEPAMRTILLVEDNEDDAFIFQRAYRNAGLPDGVQVARDGEEAWDYLLGQGRFADRGAHPAPYLVLLDLKLPFRPGLEVLRMVRGDPRLADLCVVVLTSSAESRDVLQARELGAHAFLVKPPSARVLEEIIAAVDAWMQNPMAGFPRIGGDQFEIDAPETGTGLRPR